MNQVTVFMSEALNHSLNQLIKNTGIFWNEIKWLFLSEQFNRSLNWFIQSTESLRNQSSNSFYERVIESFIQLICSKQIH